MVYIGKDTGDDPNVLLLLKAVRDGDLVETRLLIESSIVSVNAKGMSGYTPFMGAVKFDQYHIAEYLISKGADLNATNDDGETAFSMAVTKDDPRFAILLLENGAARNIMDRHGIMPFALEADDGCSITFGLVQEDGTVLCEKQVPDRRGYRTTADERKVEPVSLSPKPVAKAPAKKLRFRGASAKKRTSRKDDPNQLNFFNKLGLGNI